MQGGSGGGSCIPLESTKWWSAEIEVVVTKDPGANYKGVMSGSNDEVMDESATPGPRRGTTTLPKMDP